MNLATTIWLTLSLAVTLLVPSNPDQSFPLSIELFLLGSLALIASLHVMKLKRSCSVRISKGEKIYILALIANIAFLSFPRFLFHLTDAPRQQWVPCLNTGNFIFSFECFIQSSIHGHYGIRTFFMLLSALIIGFICFFLVRLDQRFFRYFSAVIQTVGLGVTLVNIYASAAQVSQLLPESIAINSYSYSKMTIVLPNPGWVWPYLTPSLILLCWLSASSSRLCFRTLALCSSMVVAYVILRTGQRGGVLLVSTFVFLIPCFYLDRFKLSRRRMGIAFAFLLALIAAFLLTDIDVLDGFLKKLSGADKSILALSQERLELWSVAWAIFKEDPWLGHGYGSWVSVLSEFREKSGSGYIFDTAHNLFVQIFVEYGLLHGILLLSFIVGLGYLLVGNSWRINKSERLLSVLLVSGFLICSLVQEIDYIRPTFYAFSMLIGSVAGKFEPLGVNQRTEIKISKIVAGFGVFFSSVLLGLSFAVHFGISQGLFPYEADLKRNSSSIERWTSRDFSIMLSPTTEGKFYANFMARPSVVPNRVTVGDEDIVLDIKATSVFALPVKNRVEYPDRQRIRVTAAQSDGPRLIGLRLTYPPLFTNNAIVYWNGVYSWELFPEGMGRWCNGVCRFVVRTCDRGLNFGIKNHSYGVERQHLQWKVWSIGTKLSSKIVDQKLENNTVLLGGSDLQRDQLIEISWSGSDDSFYLVEIIGSSSFVPAEVIEGNHDSRRLSFKILDGRCFSEDLEK